MKTSKRIRWVSLCVLATTILYSRVTLAQTSSQAGATADIPRTISYQGLIQSSDGQPITGEEPMTIRLYADAAGRNLVWEDTYTANVQNGVFNLSLGSQNPLPATQQMGAPLWVAVKIGDAQEMKPYAPLSASPYALTVANGSITAEKIAADYVSSIYVNGTKVTGNGSALNLMAGNGLSLSYDPVSSAIWLSAAGGGSSSGKGDQTLATRVRTFNGRSGDVVSATGDYDFSQISGNVNLTSQVSGTLPVSNGGIGVTTSSANKVFAGPTSGGAAAPSFRTLAVSDIPTLNQNTTGTAANVTGIVAKANGGTGVTNASGVAQSAFFGGPSSGGSGAASFRAIVAGDIPTLNQNTTGTAANVTGIVAIANGGTGGTTASANKVFAGPTSGGAAAPSFRSLAVSDIPMLNQNTTGTAANVTGTVAIANGGTGSTTASANRIFAGPTSGGAAAPSFRTLAASDIPTLNQNTTGTAANVTGTVAVANGGTGTATALTQGSIVFAGASGVYSQDNSHLSWDETDKRLGIGTATPAQALDVVGNIHASGTISSGQSLIIDATATPRSVTSDNTLNLSTSAGNITLNPAGKVGIGMTTPVQPLDVAGNLQFSGALMPNASAGTTGQVLVSNGANTAPSWQNTSTSVVSKIVSTQATAPTLSTNDATNITNLTLSTKATDAAGEISFTTNGSEINGDYVQLTFNANTTQPIVVLTPANEAASIASTQEVYVVATGGSPGNFQITLGTLWADAFAFDPGQTFSFYYHVIDTQ